MTPRQYNWNGMNWIRQEKRLAIYLRDGMACVYCAEGVEQGAQFTIDHLVPVEKRGTNDAKNLVTCCHRCNCMKGDRKLVEFIRGVAAYLNHGVTHIEIHKHILACIKRPLPMDEAKRLVSERGSAARALRALREGESAE